MKKALWIVVVVVVAAGALLVVKPPFLESVFPDLFVEKHKSAIRQRAMELIAALGQDDLNRCVDYIDPAFVREHGAKAVKIRFGIISLIAKAGKLTPADVQFGNIELSADHRSAIVPMNLRINNEWKAQKPGRWIRVDGKWYSTAE